MDDPMMEAGFNGFEGYAIEDEETFIVQPCISPVWDTCLAQIALAESGVDPGEMLILKSTRWLLDQQILTSGDWQIRAKNAEPGGWAFEFQNNHYPDIDDAGEVVMALALARLSPELDKQREEAIRRCVDWILGLQSKNGGWAAFDKDNLERGKALEYTLTHEANHLRLKCLRHAAVIFDVVRRPAGTGNRAATGTAKVNADWQIMTHSGFIHLPILPTP